MPSHRRTLYDDDAAEIDKKEHENGGNILWHDKRLLTMKESRQLDGIFNSLSLTDKIPSESFNEIFPGSYASVHTSGYNH